MARACSPSYSRGWDTRIAWAQEFEAAVSYDHTTALTPAWGTAEQELVSQKKKMQNLSTYDERGQNSVYLFRGEGDGDSVRKGLKKLTRMMEMFSILNWVVVIRVYT